MSIDNREHIYHLLLQKRDGTISGPDDSYVTGMIGGHEDISLMWDALKDTLAIPGEADFWQHVDTDNAWKQVNGQIAVRRTGLWWTKNWMIAAAIAAGAIVVISFIWEQKITFHKAAVLPALATDNGLRLQLADGKTIDLPYNQDHQQISAGSIHLNAGPRHLAYTANGGTGQGLNTLTVPPKMDYKLTLEDGTQVWLNATSSLRFPFNFNGDKREVYLEGEAYFNVAKKEAQPFIVHTTLSDIEVLGTTFNVSAYTGSSASMALVSGAIAASKGNERVVLRPGQQAAITPKGYHVSEFDEDEVLAWMNGQYLFHNTSLKDIAAVIERWYGVKVAFDNPEIATRKFTGGLRKQSELSSFLETLKLISDIEYYYEGNILHLK